MFQLETSAVHVRGWYYQVRVVGKLEQPVSPSERNVGPKLQMNRLLILIMLAEIFRNCDFCPPKFVWCECPSRKSIIQLYSCTAVHIYADDTQLYDFCSSSEAEALAIRVNTAIEAVSSWMSSNRLCLNLDKTKYLWFGTRQQLGKRDTVALSNMSAAMVSDTVTRNLGLLLDQELSMGDHITKLSQVCFFHLRRIRVVRHSLTRNALLTLVHAFVCSRLDFCNSAMFGVHSYLLDRLQSILNAAASTHPPDP